MYRHPPSQSEANAFVIIFLVAVSSKTSSLVGGGSPMNSAEYLSKGLGGFLMCRTHATIAYSRAAIKVSPPYAAKCLIQPAGDRGNRSADRRDVTLIEQNKRFRLRQ